MNAEFELESLRREWQDIDARGSAFNVEEFVKRGTRRMKLAMVGPIIVTIVAGGGTLLAALQSRRVEDVVLASGIWIFILSVWLGWLWISRRSWQPLTQSTKAYLDLSIHRCRAQLRALYFGGGLYVVGFASVLMWKHYYFFTFWREVLTSWPVLFFALVITPLLTYFLVVVVRGTRNQLAFLAKTRFELENFESEMN